MDIPASTFQEVEQLLCEDIEDIASDFKNLFNVCVRSVRKPNVFVTGVTGGGKSTLVNAVFGGKVVEVGDGKPVTSHITRVEPEDKPVVIFDSNGLEDGRHEEYIKETRAFFEAIRQKPNLADQIHVVWYVINAAAARLEPFELRLIQEVYAPTPVIFVLNKADLATAGQLHSLEAVARAHEFTNVRGTFRVVAERHNHNQNWCPSCKGDDVSFRSKTFELTCDECGAVEVMRSRFGLSELIEETARILPDLAKEAFLFSQGASLQLKDRRARQLILHYATTTSMDLAGKALGKVGEMVARIFILWGWNIVGYKVSGAVVRGLKEEYAKQELASRLVMIAADTLLQYKLSTSVIACLGVMVNRPLRQLSLQLLKLVEDSDPLDMHEFRIVGADKNFADLFMQDVFELGIETAVDRHWGAMPDALLCAERSMEE